MNTKNQNESDQLVINWHITEPCNFQCKYCYARWGKPKGAGEVWHKPEAVGQLLRELHSLPSIVEGGWAERPRLNIAGGEPMLLWKKGGGRLPRILDEAEKAGFDLSIISNGFLLDDGVVRTLAPRLRILGISMDSADPETNERIGRRGSKGKQIGPERMAEIFRLARSVNPGIECKLNTVVCSHNWREDLRQAVGMIAPDRWKVFQMLPVVGDPKFAGEQRAMTVTSVQFEAFKARHGDIAVMRPEDNEEMTESYVMVDPLGRFYQNQPGCSGYKHSKPIHVVGAEKAWRQVRLSAEKFRHRYEARIPARNLAPLSEAALTDGLGLQDERVTSIAVEQPRKGEGPIVIAIEGADGCGKTTIGQQLAEELGAVLVESPSSEIHLERKKIDAHFRGCGLALQLFYAATNAQSSRLISEALGQGKSVVVVRYWASTLAYNGIARESEMDDSSWLSQIAPCDFTVHLQVAPEERRRRMMGSRGDLDETDRASLRRYRELKKRYCQVPAEHPELAGRILDIHNTGTVEDCLAAILKKLQESRRS